VPFDIDNINDFNYQKDMLRGNVCRLCVSDDIDEIIHHMHTAIRRIHAITEYRCSELLKGDNTI